MPRERYYANEPRATHKENTVRKQIIQFCPKDNLPWEKTTDKTVEVEIK